MPLFMPDTSCMVPALSTWHPHHHRARSEVQRRLAGGEGLVLAAPTLMETYSTMTRLQRPYRLSGHEALALLQENFIQRAAETVALDAEAYRDLLSEAARRPILGGQIYDALIAACARRAGVETLLTFNDRHFLRLVTPPTQVIVPA